MNWDIDRGVSGTGRIGLVRWVIRKTVPKSKRSTQPARVLHDLQRLAETSPHLMPDLGFVEDRRRRGTGIRVWRRGVYVVTLRIGAARAEASVSDAPGPAPRHEAGAVASQLRGFSS